MNSNETANANVPLAVKVANEVSNYNTFAHETMAGAYTSASALTNGKENGEARNKTDKEAPPLDLTEEIVDGRVSRCW